MNGEKSALLGQVMDLMQQQDANLSEDEMAQAILAIK
jgi:hypothetical protein